MTMRERVQSVFARHRNRLQADWSAADLFTYDNDLGIAAKWGDVRHGVRANDFIPAGGISDEDLDALVSRAVDQLATVRPAHAS
jgi:hypothetical protein